MTDAPKSAGGSGDQLGSTDALRTAWNHFRSGHVVDCPVDDGTLALAVDASAGLYRFVCTQCGAASAWFECGPSGIQVRASSADAHPHEDD